MSGLFPSGSQSIGASASASASFLPMNIQVDFFRIDWCDLLSFQGTLKSLLQLSQFESSLLVLSLLYGPTPTSVHD